MPVFGDSNNVPPLLPEGDYVFCVVGFECKISQGPKTRGSDQFEVELEIEPSGKKVNEIMTDHPSCSWKIDTFLKASGIKLAKGAAFEFRQDVALASDVPWVNPLGLRGWCRITQEEVPAKENRKAFTVNRVGTFYTDRPKLPARVIEVPEEDKPF